MASAFDVAAHILQKHGEMTAMKLQKLVYYSQAWHSVWEDEPLFNEPVEAWINGPVVRCLYSLHQGKFTVNANSLAGKGKAERLSTTQKESIEMVLQFYADKPSQWLSDLTHAEEPWKNARKGLSPNERGNNEISVASMVEYYSALK